MPVFNIENPSSRAQRGRNSVAIVVGFGVSELDRHIGISESFVAALDDAIEAFKREIESSRRGIQYYLGSPQGQMEFIQRFSGMR